MVLGVLLVMEEAEAGVVLRLLVATLLVLLVACTVDQLWKIQQKLGVVIV